MRYLISKTIVLATNILVRGSLVSLVYLNPGQLSLPISSCPSLRQIFKSSWRAKNGVLLVLALTHQSSLAHKPYNGRSRLLSSGPGDELKECPRESQECLCLTWQVASLPCSGQGMGVGKYFCFLLEMTTMAKARHKSFNCPEGDSPSSKGQRETWPHLFWKSKCLPGTTFYPWATH